MTRAGLLVAAMAALAIAGCSKPGGDKGELATVGGEKVTAAHLDAELKAIEAARPDDPAVRREALDRIVTRKLLAQAARAEKLDRSPQNSLMKTAALETFEAGLELRAIGDKVAAPTAAEAAAFVQDHPEMFAQRTGYLIEQLHVNAKPDPALIAALQPTKSLADVERILQGHNIPFRRSVEQLDSLRADPRITAAVRKLAPGEPLVMSEPYGFSVSSVRQSSVQPVVGPQATAIAAKLLAAQQRDKAMNDRITALKAEKVKYPTAK